MKPESPLALISRKISVFRHLHQLKSWRGWTLLLIALFHTGQVSSAAEYKLPSANQGWWTPGTDVGVVGGIDQYRVGGASARTNLINVTQAPYNADNTGATNASPAIKAAIDAAAANDVIYLPAGTYKIATTIYLENNDSNKTIRGAGDATILYGTIASGIEMFRFTGSDPLTSSGTQTVTGTKTKGTTTLNVSSTAGYSVGDLAKVTVENELNNTRILAGAAPTWSSSGFTGLRSPVVMVTGVTSNTVSIWPPLIWDCTPYSIVVSKSQLDWFLRKIGFEDFSVTFDAANHPPFIIGMNSGVECWAYNIKALEWKKTTSSGSCIWIGDSYKCEVRKCDFRTQVPATYSDDGAIQIAGSSCLLIEDNIMVGFDGGLYDSGRTYNNVVAYNYMPCDSNYPGHNGHNSLTLFEGNVAPNFHLDSYHGSGSHQTFYRNWLYHGLYVKRFMYYMASVGNVFGENGVRDEGNSFGNPNIGNSSYAGTANHFTGDPHVDWGMTGTLTTRTSDTAGVVTVSGGDFVNNGVGALISLYWSGLTVRRVQMSLTAVSGLTLTLSGGSGAVLPAQGTKFDGVYTFAGGYQEQDLGVEYTMMRADNYHSKKVGPGGVQNDTSDTLRDSLAHISKPRWFGDLAWPPVNPDAPKFGLDIIPAGYRFKNGVNPPGITTPTPATRPAPVSGLKKTS
jgi:hypothetical protein